MYDKCPGASFLRTPTLKIVNCPKCGEEVELFSTDVKVVCDNCGIHITNNMESCIQSCLAAESCLGEELYEKLFTSEKKASSPSKE